MGNAAVQMVEAGRLRWPVLLRKRMDLPLGESDVHSEFSAPLRRWADIRPVGAATYADGVQTGHAMTHRIYLRWEGVFDTSYEVVCGAQTYRVLRCSDLQGARRLTVLEVEQLQ